MAIAETVAIKGLMVMKAVFVGALKLAIAAGPMGVPMFIAGGVGTALVVKKINRQRHSHELRASK